MWPIMTKENSKEVKGKGGGVNPKTQPRLTQGGLTQPKQQKKEREEVEKGNHVHDPTKSKMTRGETYRKHDPTQPKTITPDMT